MKKLVGAVLISGVLTTGLAAPAFAEPATPTPKEQCQQLDQKCLDSLNKAGSDTLAKIKGTDIAKRVQEIAKASKVTAKDVLQDPEKYLNRSLDATIREAERLKLSPETKHELETLNSQIRKLYATDGKEAVQKLRGLHQQAATKLAELKQKDAALDQKLAETLAPVVEQAKESTFWKDLKKKVHDAAKSVTEATK